jgi:hypothetical protein
MIGDSLLAVQLENAKENRGMRRLVHVTAVAVLCCSSTVTHAQQPDFTGRWVLSGQIIAGRSFMSFAQVCDLKQSGDQVAGPCRGPNGGCSAVGVVNGTKVDLTCRTTNTNSPELAGVLTVHGELGADEIVRGPCSHSRLPGGNGVSAMMRI